MGSHDSFAFVARLLYFVRVRLLVRTFACSAQFGVALFGFARLGLLDLVCLFECLLA